MVASTNISLLFSLVALAASRSFPDSPSYPAARARAVAAEGDAQAPAFTGFPPLPVRVNFIEHQAWLLSVGGDINQTSTTIQSSDTTSSTQTSDTQSSSQSTESSQQGTQTPVSSVGTATTAKASTAPDGIVISGSVGASIGGLVPISVGLGGGLSLPVPPLITPPAIVLPSFHLQQRQNSLTETRTAPPNPKNKNAVCPENVGMDPKPCSECGGDSKKKGICDNILYSGQQHPDCTGDWQVCYGWYCACKEDAPEKGNMITATTVVDGQTGTVVWKPSTISAYTDLKASTTITLTASETVSGESELETALVVVFAGGVTWMVASENGAAVAVESIDIPPELPEGSKEDDKVCEPPETCDNCGGASDTGLCKSGDKAGCPCEKQECPTTVLSCSASECGGDDGNGNCKASGKTKGCPCCPDEKPWCNNKLCHGDKNAKCQQDKLKGCACNPYVKAKANDDPRYAPDNGAAITSGADDAYSRIWSGKPPGYETTTTTTSKAFCVAGADPKGTKVPEAYCQCGSNYDTTYSVVSGTNPCPFSPSSTGKIVTFSDATPTKSSTTSTTLPVITQTVSPLPKSTTTTKKATTSCDPNCGAPFCC